MTIGDMDIPWSSLVGEGIKLPGGHNLTSVTSARLVVDMENESAPPSAVWKTRFGTSIGATNGKIPYPTHAELLRELRSSISGTPPKLKRGPLQLILELEWGRTLSGDRGGSVA
jgi:hypothetical protein